MPLSGEFFDNRDDRVVKELDLVDGDDGRFRCEQGGDFAGLGNRLRFELLPVMAGDTFDAVAMIDDRLKDLDVLPGDGGAADTADQFLGLAAKHAPANHLDAS